MKIWWNTKAWPWLQKNWQWILLPIGLLSLASKVLSSRSTTVVSSGLTKVDEVEQKANEEATRIVQVAEVKKEAELASINKEHAEVIRVLTDDQKSKVGELSHDPAALNAFLLGLGKEIRK